ncbi:MAG: response regulator [Clostridiales bacterium]|nr:response regulator [Clostridiales bacterium]
MKKNRKHLLSRISATILAMVLLCSFAMPCFAVNDVTDFNVSKVTLTEEEQAYVEAHKDNPIAVAISDDLSPVEYYDKKAGEYQGFVVALYDLITKETGLKFSFVARGNNEETRQQIADGTIQLVGSLSNNPAVTSTFGVVASTQFYTNAISVITKNTWSGTGNTHDCVAVKAGYPVFTQIAKNLGYTNIVEYDSFQECIDAVNNGDADITLISSTGENVLLGHAYYSKLTSIMLADITGGYSIGVADNEDTEVLLSIINKSIENIPNEQLNQLRLLYILKVQPERNFKDVLYENSASFLVLLILFALAAVIFIYLRMREKQKVAKVLQGNNDQLKQVLRERDEAIKAANIANAAKSEFLSRISHDIRTPLNAVLGFSALARIEEDNPVNTMEYLREIDDSGRYLLDIINDVLDMSKIESGKLELHKESVNVIKLANSIADIFREEARVKGIKLITDFPDIEDRWLMTDSLRLKRVFSNLLSNAIKNSASGTTIRWTINEVLEENGFLYFSCSISDQGCGMTEEFMARMFEPFTQADAENANVGTGLGLAIVKSLVDLMDGSIDVKSEVGVGTIFNIGMKMEIGEPPLEEDIGLLSSEENLAGCHIHLCEDHPLNAQIVVKLLGKKHAKVDVAKNGIIGVDKFTQSEIGFYDAILMDIQMPVMNGLEATRTIRALDRDDAKTIPIIAMSANAFADDVNKSIVAGMDGYVTKPIDVQILYRTLTKFISTANGDANSKE